MSCWQFSVEATEKRFTQLLIQVLMCVHYMTQPVWAGAGRPLQDNSALRKQEVQVRGCTTTQHFLPYPNSAAAALAM